MKEIHVKILGLHEVEVPISAFDNVQFQTLHNAGGFAEFAITPISNGEPVNDEVAMLVWLTSPQETTNLDISHGIGDQVVWQDQSIENRIVWRGLLHGTTARLYVINRLVEVERPVYLSVLRPDGRVVTMDPVVITRYVAPQPV